MLPLPATFRTALPSADWNSHAHDRVSVLLVEVSPWLPWLAAAAAILTPAEAGRVARHRLASQRDELTIAYALHRLAIAEFLQCEADAVELGRDERGRPIVAGESVQTSLSHTEGYFAIAVSPLAPVGVDIERSSRASGMAEIAPLLCHADEARLLADASGRAGEQLLGLWVRKEALLKAAGIGLTREMRDFVAPEGIPLPCSTSSGAKARLGMLDAGERCVAAVAAPIGLTINCAWLRPQVVVRSSGEVRSGLVTQAVD